MTGGCKARRVEAGAVVEYAGANASVSAAAIHDDDLGGLRVLRDVRQCFLHYAVYLQLHFFVEGVAGETFGYVRAAFDSGSLAEVMAKVAQRVLYSQEAEVRGDEVVAGDANPVDEGQQQRGGGAKLFPLFFADGFAYGDQLQRQAAQILRDGVVQVAADSRPFVLLRQKDGMRIRGAFPFPPQRRFEFSVKGEYQSRGQSDEKNEGYQQYDVCACGKMLCVHVPIVDGNVFFCQTFVMTMAKPKAARFFALSLLCVAAAVLNLLSAFLVFDTLRVPLFVDTVFTVAVLFHAGLIPGLAVVLLNWVFWAMINSVSPFVIVSVVEVILIWRLRPVGTPWPGFRSKRAFDETVSVCATLTLLYIATSVSASVLGGLIDYVFLRMEDYKPFGPGHVFGSGFYGGEIHPLAIGILSRFPINIIDRFIVVFGGFFIALGLGRLKRKFRVFDDGADAKGGAVFHL